MHPRRDVHSAYPQSEDDFADETKRNGSADGGPSSSGLEFLRRHFMNILRAERNSRTNRNIEEYQQIKDLDERLITQSGHSATLTIFFASLDGTILQYVQDAFNGQPHKTYNTVVSVFLYLSLVTAISSTLSFASLTGRNHLFTTTHMPPEPEGIRHAKRRVSRKYLVVLYSMYNLHGAVYCLFVAVMVYVWANLPHGVAIPVTAAVVMQAELRLLAHASLLKMSNVYASATTVVAWMLSQIRELYD